MELFIFIQPKKRIGFVLYIFLFFKVFHHQNPKFLSVSIIKRMAESDFSENELRGLDTQNAAFCFYFF